MGARRSDVQWPCRVWSTDCGGRERYKEEGGVGPEGEKQARIVRNSFLAQDSNLRKFGSMEKTVSKIVKEMGTTGFGLTEDAIDMSIPSQVTNVWCEVHIYFLSIYT